MPNSYQTNDWGSLLNDSFRKWADPRAYRINALAHKLDAHADEIPPAVADILRELFEVLAD
jgi:hypothetical protein